METIFEKVFFYDIYFCAGRKSMFPMYFNGAIRKKQGFHGLSIMLAQLPSWHNFPLEQLPPGTTSQITTSHWHNFPIHTTSLWHNLPLVQLPYGTTYPWHNLSWNNFPMAQVPMAQLPEALINSQTARMLRAREEVCTIQP